MKTQTFKTKHVPSRPSVLELYLDFFAAHVVASPFDSS